MERFLLTLSIGPVQGLIGAARRTRDLWCGSWLLSEAARAAAALLHERHPECLIFPCFDDPESNLVARERPDESAGYASVANVLRAEVRASDARAVRALCADAKTAASARLRELGEGARKGLAGVREDVWEAQIGAVLEGFSAWVTIADRPGAYGEASERLGEALAARKATRDFSPSAPLRTPGLPKSSLDGALETVLLPSVDRRKLGLSDGEQLDALGVIKRLAEDPEQFTAYARVAADPWIMRLTSTQRASLRSVYEELVRHGLATRVRGNAGIYRELPYDALLLYDFRLDNALRAAHGNDRDALEALQNAVARISREENERNEPVGDPVPYAAILKADGDRMGKLLARAACADESRKISRKLNRFAASVRKIVREHRGHAVYAGGDDVLALVPLANALECAEALANEFTSALSPVAAEMDVPPAERPTLSVGIGIGHVMEPLSALRARADRAEHLAKGDASSSPRNALAILLGIRSGAELGWRAQWTDRAAFEALRRFSEAYSAGSLPTRVANDLRGIDRQCAWLRNEADSIAAGIRRSEVDRMLARARIRGGATQVPDALRKLVLERAGAQSLGELADTLFIARWLAARRSSDLGERA